MDDDTKVEAACLAALSSRGLEPEAGKSALVTITNAIVAEMDDAHHDALLEENGDDPSAVWEAVGGIVRDITLSHTYAAPALTLHRGVRVTCPPEEVRVTGTADDIGHSWSTESEIRDPEFLNQYGEEGGRDVFIVAEVDHADIDWFSTLEQRVNPWIRDYEEIVLLGKARPRVISVSDPGSGPAPGS